LLLERRDYIFQQQASPNLPIEKCAECGKQLRTYFVAASELLLDFQFREDTFRAGVVAV
jgi:uncharacterized protein (UPF0212 family)